MQAAIKDQRVQVSRQTYGNLWLLSRMLVWLDEDVMTWHISLFMGSVPDGYKSFTRLISLSIDDYTSITRLVSPSIKSGEAVSVLI